MFQNSAYLCLGEKGNAKQLLQTIYLQVHNHLQLFLSFRNGQIQAAQDIWSSSPLLFPLDTLGLIPILPKYIANKGVIFTFKRWMMFFFFSFNAHSCIHSFRTGLTITGNMCSVKFRNQHFCTYVVFKKKMVHANILCETYATVINEAPGL